MWSEIHQTATLYIEETQYPDRHQMAILYRKYTSGGCFRLDSHDGIIPDNCGMSSVGTIHRCIDASRYFVVVVVVWTLVDTETVYRELFSLPVTFVDLGQT